MKQAILAVLATAVLMSCASSAPQDRSAAVAPAPGEHTRVLASELARRLAQATRGSVIEFSHFSNLDYVAITESVTSDDGVEIWQGTIGDGSFWGSAIVAVEGSEVVGMVQVDDSIYSIRTEGGELVVTEIDETLFPEEDEPVRGPLREAGMSRPVAGPRPTEESPVTLRVLLVIPPPLAKYCSPPSSRLIASMSKASLDGVWKRFTHGAVGSGVSVYCTPHDSAGGNLLSDLEWVTNDPDVQEQRRVTNSNLVAFIVPEASSCGISNANYPVTDAGASARAFSVVRLDCAWENYSLAHELGHQLGMDHDRYTIKGGYYDRCNYGFSFRKDDKPVARDVMAYSGYCTSLGLTCPRIGTYSYADTIDGVQLGVPCSVTGDLSPATGAANNVEELLKAAPVAATWH